MGYLDALRSLFTIIGGSIAVILFDVSAPVPEWAKILFTIGVIAAIIAVFINFRKRKNDNIVNDSPSGQPGSSVIRNIGARRTEIRGKIRARNFDNIVTNKNTGDVIIDAEIEATKENTTKKEEN